MPRLWIILFALSVPCGYAYFHVVWLWWLEKLGHVELWDTSTHVYLVGLAMHLMVIMGPHKRGDLLVCGVPTGITIGAGPWFIPNIFHITITLFNWAIGGRIAVEGEEFEEKEEDFLRIRFDSKDSFHHIHSQASLFGVTLFRGAGELFSFLVGYKQGKAHETISRFGFRVMLFSFILAWWNNDLNRHVDSVRPTFSLPSFSLPSFSFGSNNSRAPSSHLTEDLRPVMPYEAVFEINESKEVVLYADDVDGRGTKYFLYQSPDEQGRSILIVRESLCAAVPAGKRAFFLAKRPLSGTMFMVDQVTYMQKKKFFFIPLGTEPTTKTLDHTRANWEEVDTDRLIVLQAKDQADNPYPKRGGVVCFK